VEQRVREAIRKHIIETWLNDDARGFTDDTDLQETGILDSFATLGLVAFIEETLNVQIEPADINTETFRSVDAITKLVVERSA